MYRNVVTEMSPDRNGPDRNVLFRAQQGIFTA